MERIILSLLYIILEICLLSLIDHVKSPDPGIFLEIQGLISLLPSFMVVTQFGDFNIGAYDPVLAGMQLRNSERYQKSVYCTLIGRLCSLVCGLHLKN